MAQSFEGWWASLGLVTKGFLIGSTGLSLLLSFGFTTAQDYLVNFAALSGQLQLWRVVTSVLFFGYFGFPWLLNMANTVMVLHRLESFEFDGDPARMVWMFLFCASVLHIPAFVLNMQLLSFSMSMVVCWILCKRQSTMQLSLFGFSFSASSFPWALLSLHFLMGMGVVDDVVGILVGHLYVLLTDILPKTHHINLLKTPRWLQNILPPTPRRVHTVFHPGGNAVPPPRAGHRWGAGHRLGGQ